MDLGRNGVRKAVAISVLVHALAAAWAMVVYWLWPPPPRLVEAPPIEIEVVTVARAPEPVPTAVLRLYEPAEVQLPDAAPQRIGTTATTRPAEIPNSAPATGVPSSSLLAMRTPGVESPRAIDLSFHPSEGTLAAGKAPPPEVEATGRLAPHGGGSYQSNEGVFTAKVAPDGSVKIKDSKNFNVHLRLPGPKTIGRGVADWYESDKGAYGGDGKRSLADKVAGSIDKEDRSKAAVVPVLGGGFDVGDALMRRHGQDPYASRKLAYLDATRDERVQIGNRHRADQLAQSTRLMQKNLDRMWATVTDTAARKRALFELWDECAETGEPAVVEGGRAARKLVIGFIRARLPAAGATAYTASELATLSRERHSSEEFAPYAE